MTDIFPTFNDDDVEYFSPDQDLDESEGVEPALPYGFTWRFDFDAGDIMLDDGGNAIPVEGIKTVMEWVTHTLAIRRFESPIYGTDVGTDLQDLIGSKQDSYILSRARQEIQDALLKHDRIIAVNVLECFTIGFALYALIEFTTDDEERADALFQINQASN